MGGNHSEDTPVRHAVRLGGPLQRNAKHEARLPSFSGLSLLFGRLKRSEIESLVSRTSSAALQLRFAQDDSDARFCSFQLAHIRRVSPIWRDEFASGSEYRSRGDIAAGALCHNAGI